MPFQRPLALIAFFIFYVLSSGFAQAGEMPETFNNEYSARLFGFKVTVKHQLTQRPEGGQRLRFHAKSWFASITETTDFTWTDEGQVKPQHYTYKRRGLGSDQDEELTFNWQDGTVINNIKEQSWEMDARKNVQDQLSYQVQLQKDLIDGENQLNYHIADGGRLKDYRFEVVGEEVMDTPLGKVETVKVKRSRDDDDRITYAWLAKNNDYMLVRLQQIEDGDSYSISISKAELNGEPIKQF